MKLRNFWPDPGFLQKNVYCSLSHMKNVCNQIGYRTSSTHSKTALQPYLSVYNLFMAFSRRVHCCRKCISCVSIKSLRKVTKSMESKDLEFKKKGYFLQKYVREFLKKGVVFRMIKAEKVDMTAYFSLIRQNA